MFSWERDPENFTPIFPISTDPNICSLHSHATPLSGDWRWRYPYQSYSFQLSYHRRNTEKCLSTRSVWKLKNLNNFKPTSYNLRSFQNIPGCIFHIYDLHCLLGNWYKQHPWCFSDLVSDFWEAEIETESHQAEQIDFFTWQTKSNLTQIQPEIR